MKWSIPEKVVEEGREYAKEGRVVGISKNETQHVWHADVVGAQVYHVELDGSAKEEDVCQCLYWQTHGYCKHTVAVELALRNDGQSRFIKKQQVAEPVYRQPSLSQLFTDGFERLSEDELKRTLIDSTLLQVDYEVHVVETLSYHTDQSVLAVSLKVGNRAISDRTYVVKNIAEFLEIYEKKGTYQLNKQRLSVGLKSFTQKDDVLLAWLLDIQRQQELLEQTGVQHKGQLNRKFMMLTAEQAKHLIGELQFIGKLSLKVGEHTFRQVAFKEGKLPLTVTVFPIEETSYRLSVSDSVLVFLEKYHWAIAEQGIYELTPEQTESYKVLRLLLRRLNEPELLFPEEQVSELFTYVLPSLELISQVTIPEFIDEQMIRLPLQPHIFITKEGAQLMVRVDFQYGEMIFSSNDAYNSELGHEALVVRDSQQEKRVAFLLEHFGYGKRRTHYLKRFPEGYELYTFFREELPVLKKYMSVTLDDSVSVYLLDDKSHQPEANVLDQGSWLAIHFDISDIDENEINDVLLSLMKQEDYHQLSNGQLLMLDDDGFRQTSHVLQQLRGDFKLNNGQLTVPTYRGLAVQEALSYMDQSATSETFSHMVADLTQPEGFNATLPKGLQATLRDYQLSGFKWMKMLSHYQFGGILADDMGLGKTIQAIAYMLSEKEEGRLTEPCLIVAPASLIYNWKLEVKRFAPDLRVSVVVGAKEGREVLLDDLDHVDVVITSYATLRQDVSLYQKQGFHTLILDEAQMIKNATTKTFQAIATLDVDRRFALSGTPIENRLEELWALFKILMPGFFPGIRQFKQLSNDTIATMIQPFVLRRIKKDVLQELPDKIETDVYSQLTEPQKTVYLAYLKQMQQSMAQMNPNDFKKQRMSILAGLTRLRQICCDPSLFVEGYDGGSGKLEQALDLIQQAKSNGRRVLLFSQFTSMLSIIEEKLNEAQVETFYLRGSTPLQTRQELVNRFNRGEKDVFLISLKAGGTGLNLTGADTVILYDLWWNPAVEDQATGRAHRMGQTKKVEVWRLIAEGTVEEKMNQLQQEKKELFQQVLHSDNAPALSSMNMDDIRTILEIGDDEEMG